MWLRPPLNAVAVGATVSLLVNGAKRLFTVHAPEVDEWIGFAVIAGLPILILSFHPRPRPAVAIAAALIAVSWGWYLLVGVPEIARRGYSEDMATGILLLLSPVWITGVAALGALAWPRGRDPGRR
jgi:hypothetical protein